MVIPLNLIRLLQCIVLQAGLIVHLPVKDIYLQSWQEPVVRVYDGDGNWTDVVGTAPILHVQDGRKVTFETSQRRFNL